VTLWTLTQAGMGDVVVVTRFTERIAQHSIRQFEQIAEPQSAHVATADLPHGVPTSLSLAPKMIWQFTAPTPRKPIHNCASRELALCAALGRTTSPVLHFVSSPGS
jgi:hypothetical protein